MSLKLDCHDTIVPRNDNSTFMTQPMSHEIVACARSWIGTRFHHQGRLKKTESHAGGVDCLGLLVGIASELGLKDGSGRLLADYDETDYTHTPAAERLLANLSQHLTVVDTVTPGCIVALHMDDSPRHLGIISDYGDGLGLIHAYAQARKVVEHALDAEWRRRIIRMFQL